MKKIILFLFVPVLVQANLPKSLIKVNQLAQYLLAIADGTIAKEKSCQISSDQALKMMSPLKSYVDSEVKKYISDQKNKFPFNNWAKTCEADCNCNLYSTIIETSGLRLNKANKKLYRKIATKASNQNKKFLAQCALRARIRCEDSLFKELKSNLPSEEN